MTPAEQQVYAARVHALPLSGTISFEDRSHVDVRRMFPPGCAVRLDAAVAMPIGLAAGTTYFVGYKPSGAVYLQACMGGASVDFSSEAIGVLWMMRADHPAEGSGE